VFLKSLHAIGKFIARSVAEKKREGGGEHSSAKSLISAAAKTFLISGAGPIEFPVISPHDGSVMPPRL